jgi:hypothetical protein
VIFPRTTAGWTWGFIAAKAEHDALIEFAIAALPAPAVSAVHDAIVCGMGVEPDHEIWCSRLIRVFWRVVGIVRGVSRD